MSNFGIWFRVDEGRQYIGGTLDGVSFIYDDNYFWPSPDRALVDRTVWTKVAEGVLSSW